LVGTPKSSRSSNNINIGVWMYASALLPRHVDTRAPSQFSIKPSVFYALISDAWDYDALGVDRSTSIILGQSWLLIFLSGSAVIGLHELNGHQLAWCSAKEYQPLAAGLQAAFNRLCASTQSSCITTYSFGTAESIGSKSAGQMQLGRRRAKAGRKRMIKTFIVYKLIWLGLDSFTRQWLIGENWLTMQEFMVV
jgi:hypothetical protein